MNTPTPYAEVVKELTDATPGAPAPYSILLAQAVITIAKLQQQNIALLADKTRLSTLCDKWNFDADEMREDNMRLAGEMDALKKQKPASETTELSDGEIYSRISKRAAEINATFALKPTPFAWLRSLDEEPISDALKQASAAFYERYTIPLLLASGAQPTRAPLTKAQKYQMWVDATIELPSPQNCYLRGVDDAERLLSGTQLAAGAQPGCISNCDTCINARGSPAHPGYCRMFYTEPQGDCGKWSSSAANPCAASDIGEAMP